MAGKARHGKARQAGQGTARLGMARRGRQGSARRGKARRGAARQGTAGEARTMTPKEFKQKLTDTGWTQADFARKTGVTPMTVSRWVTGEISHLPSWVDGYLDMVLSIKEQSRLISK